MARSFHKSLLAAVVALVVGGSAIAQETPLQEAVKLLRLNKNDEAVEKLREIIQADPSNEEAHELYQSVSQDEWYMLMISEGEIQKIARSILERAKVTRGERIRDEDTIQSLVDLACSKDAEWPARQDAINQLVANHGEFAVPALAKKLGNSDDADGQIQAISVLSRLGNVAVLPLIEVLKSSNDVAVQNAAAALHMIGDRRAAPIMAHLKDDDRENISMVARRFLKKYDIRGDALGLMLAQSDSYLQGNVPQGGYSDVVWKLVDDALVATDVPSQLYPTELAKSVAADAVRVAPSSLPARSALAQANLAQANLIETSAAQGVEALAEMQPVADELKIAALASGTDALRAALDAGVQKRLAPVAIGAIDALADAEIVDSISESSLVAALNSSNKQIKFAAAEAIVRASRGSDIPAASSVVAALAEAVAEERLHTIHVIAPEGVAGAAAQSANAVRDQVVVEDANAVSGIKTQLARPFDVLVINEILPDALPEVVIGNIRKDPRTANTKVIVIAKDVDAAAEHFGDDVAFVQAPLTAENLQAAIATAVEGVESAAGARAESIATKASGALLSLAQRKADIGGALSNLAHQLTRGDAVAVPAAKAIGLAGDQGQLPALQGALKSGSDDLKKAAATAIGDVLGRMSSCPEDVAMDLMAAMDAASDTELRKAIAIAFGKAKLDAQKKLELMQKLNRIASSSEG